MYAYIPLFVFAAVLHFRLNLVKILRLLGVFPRISYRVFAAVSYWETSFPDRWFIQPPMVYTSMQFFQNGHASVLHIKCDT